MQNAKAAVGDNRLLNPTLPILDLVATLYIIGLVCSKALLSISMIGIVGIAIFNYKQSDQKAEGWYRVKPFVFPSLIFVVTILSGMNSDDLIVWGQYISKKLPFLLLPPAFYVLKSHFAVRYHLYMMGFVVVVSIVSLGILTNYLLHMETINSAIGKGKAITGLIDHTEFSLYVAYACIISLGLYFEKGRVIPFGSRSTPLLLAIFLILFLHIMAVRSGLVVFYLTLFLLGSYTFIKEKKYKSLLLLMCMLTVTPYMAIKTIPSLQNKMNYVKWDISRYKKNKGLSYSDSERLYSLKAGWTIFKKAPAVGVGLGDLKQECQTQYLALYGRTLNHYPHNQYLFTLAGMGLIGFLFYTIALLGPWWHFRSMANLYFAGLNLVIFISALVENTLERTFSIGFYLFFTLISLCFMTKKWKSLK